MKSSRYKFIRFKNFSPERSSSFDQKFFSGDGEYPSKPLLTLNAVLDSIWRGLEIGSQRIKRLGIPISLPSEGSQSTRERGSLKKVLDPQGEFLQKWNKIFVFSCLIALAIDPLFFYIPVLDTGRKCLDLDTSLEITACVFRTFNDLFHLLHIVFQFRTGFIAPSSRVFGRGVLIDDPFAIAKKYLSSSFIIDILAILPLPQVVVLVVVPMATSPVSLITKELLKIVIFAQYVPRIWRMIPIYRQITRTSGIFTEIAWLAAAFNLFCYMLASHFVGAFWYMLAIEREDTCWHEACSRQENCSSSVLYCGKDLEGNKFLDASCPLIQPDQITNSTVFNFGIFFDALQSGVLESKDFRQKFFYCFWWGLRGLSSLGQNLKTSTFVWEIIFAVFISIFGLLLFSSLIGNMQKYLQSTSVRIEEMRVKRQDAEQWMSHRMLPEDLRDRIRRYDQYRWQETRGVEEESLIRNLPKDLRRDIKRHLCLGLLKKVPVFEKMDEQLMDALCNGLKPVLFTENSFIFREGDPVDAMLFIMRGSLETVTTNGGRSGFYNSVRLAAGEFCGEELLTWALDSHSSANLPISTRTVKAPTEVEAFALMADDLKFVASQFRRLHSKQFKQTFRFYSLQWKTWATFFIQAAWRRYKRRKLDKSFSEAETRLCKVISKGGGSSPSLGAAIYASRFAANALRNLRRNGSQNSRLPPLLPQKPTESDYTADGHSIM